MKKSILPCLAGVIGWVFSVVAGASTYATEPLLRIEAIMHTAPMAQIATDASGRYLVTGSADQTLRLWDLTTQRMLRVYRLPVVPDSTSRHQAVAISPDGEQIAAGSVVPGPSSSIYIFSRTTGEIIRHLPGLPSELVSLVWSPDGRYLLLVSNRHGIRVYRASDWALIGEDNYGSESWRGDISINNRIAVTSFDGLLRVYQIDAAGLRLTAMAPSGGARPVGVSFSPEGERLAVGFLEAPKVLVYAETNLKKLYAASTEKAGNGSLYEVEWGKNDVLYAGGQYRQGSALGELFSALGGGSKRATLIRRWQKGGLGAWRDIEAANDSINSLSSLPDGGVVYATMDPAWGIINANGTGEFVQRAYNADFYGQSGIKISPDGLVVEFPYQAYGKSPASFNVLTRTLTEGENTSAKGATQSARGIDLSTKGTFPRTLFNGRELPLEAGEFERGKAVAEDGGGFVIATDFHLRFYDRDGREVWRKRTPTAPRGGVNISQDGRLIVASYQDGSIHWYRCSDGQELLAFWPHADRKRWVLWSPAGFYDAAPGSEEFLGWHINRFGEIRELLVTQIDPDGPAAGGGMRAGDAVKSIDGVAIKSGADLSAHISAAQPGRKLKFLISRAGQSHTLWITPGRESGTPKIKIAYHEVRPSLTPAFYSVGRFRERFYRPDILEKVLTTLDVDEAMRLANQESGRVEQVTDVTQVLPPVLTLQSTQDDNESGSDTVTLRFSVNAPKDAPATDFLARVNGKPVEIGKPRNLAIGNAEGTTIQEIMIPIPEENSEIMLFASNRNGTSEPASTRVRWIGKVNTTPEYRPRLFVLAAGVSDYANEKLRLGFAAKDAMDLTNRMSNQKARLYSDVEVRSITDRQVTRGSLVAGLKWLESKVTVKDIGIVFLAGHGISDARGSYYYLASDANEKNYRESGLSFIDIRNTLAKLKGRALFMVDTCHSGDVLGRKGLDINYVANDLSSPENGVVVMAASTGNQASQERKDWGNGAFTKAVLEGVDGRADTRGTGKITYKMLDLYVSGRVEDLTKGRQTPFTIVPVGIVDFPVAQSR